MKNKVFLSFFLVMLVLSGYTQPQTALLLNKESKDRVIEHVCEALLKNYVFPEKATLMVKYLKEQQQKGSYDALTTPVVLANHLSKYLRTVSNDSHLRIAYDPELEKDILKFLSSKKAAIKITKADIARDENKNFYFKKLEILPSNIGYIECNGFALPGASTSKTIHAAMQFVAHTDALILDFRNNFGGNAVSSEEVAGYFFTSKTFTGRSFNKINNTWTNQYIVNNKQGLALKMPVYLLTSSRTFSAAEGLAYSLQKIKNATVVGDTTRGGAHLTRSFSLGNGFVGFIPFTRGENVVTKTDWEGIGVIPDITADENNALQVALNLILQKKLKTADNDTERRKINYIIHQNQSKYTLLAIQLTDALKYTGRFAEFDIKFEDNQLWCRDTNQPAGSYRKMLPISQTLFQVGNDYQIEFVLQQNICTAIKMYWDDGYEDNVFRNGQ